ALLRRRFAIASRSWTQAHAARADAVARGVASLRRAPALPAERFFFRVATAPYLDRAPDLGPTCLLIFAATVSTLTPSSLPIASHAIPPLRNSTTWSGVTPGFLLARANPYAIATSPYPRPQAECCARSESGEAPSCFDRRSSTASSPSGVLASRSEEHTSELQSRGHLVCRLLLEKKKLPAW